MSPKYPEIEVQLTDVDSNAFAILGRVNTALKEAGIDGEERKAFFTEAISGNYDHLLQTAKEWVTVT